MTRRPSPIERMIDAAAGYKPGAPSRARNIVTLHCPKCARTKGVLRDPTDPPNATVVQAPCDRCDRGGDKPETMYFDAQGRQLNCDGEVISGPDR